MFFPLSSLIFNRWIVKAYSNFIDCLHRPLLNLNFSREIHTYCRKGRNYRTNCASQVVLVVKNPPHQCRRHERHRFNPWIGKIPWRWHSCLENPTDRGARQATVHRVVKSRTGCSNLACLHRTNWWKMCLYSYYPEINRVTCTFIFFHIYIQGVWCQIIMASPSTNIFFKFPLSFNTQ